MFAKPANIIKAFHQTALLGDTRRRGRHRCWRQHDIAGGRTCSFSTNEAMRSATLFMSWQHFSAAWISASSLRCCLVVLFLEPECWAACSCLYPNLCSSSLEMAELVWNSICVAVPWERLSLHLKQAEEMPRHLACRCGWAIFCELDSSSESSRLHHHRHRCRTTIAPKSHLIKILRSPLLSVSNRHHESAAKTTCEACGCKWFRGWNCSGWKGSYILCEIVVSMKYERYCEKKTYDSNEYDTRYMRRITRFLAYPFSTMLFAPLAVYLTSSR